MSGGGIAAGAAAGNQIMPGWGTAIGAVAGGLMDMGGGGSPASPAGPSILDALTDTSVDFSGWTVATGGSKADATNSKAEAGGFPVWAQLAIAGVLLIVAVKVLRK